MVTGCGVWVSAAHAAGTGAHAPNTNGPRSGQLLDDFGSGDVELSRIDLPAVSRRDVAERLRVELTRQCDDAEFLDGVADDLRARVINLERRVEILIHEELHGFQQTENGLLAYLAAPPDAIFLRAHVQ